MKLTAKFLGLFLVCLVLFASCKPKQSAYKSVYEAAKEKDVQDDEALEPSTEIKYTPSYPATNESVRKEKVTPVYDYDASSLKADNVVIAAMGMKPNAESLKRRMENEGYKIILVQNEQGMFRVLIGGSFDSKEEAAAKKSQILSDFFAKGDQETLKAKYGIPFNDWWILQRD